MAFLQVDFIGRWSCGANFVQPVSHMPCNGAPNPGYSIQYYPYKLCALGYLFVFTA